MMIKESYWLKKELAKVPSKDLSPLLDIGSSTLHFRTKIQPNIDDNIFKPLRKRKRKIIHLDIKKGKGIDVTGSLLDLSFFKKISKRKIKSIIVSNFFEHVIERQKFANAILNLIPSGGYIFVSGPYKYPFHADTIDTGFRPTIKEIATLFPGTEIINSKIINSGNWKNWNKTERGGRSLIRFIIRLFTPFYHTKKWLEVWRGAQYIFKDIKSFAVVLRKI